MCHHFNHNSNNNNRVQQQQLCTPTTVTGACDVGGDERVLRGAGRSALESGWRYFFRWGDVPLHFLHHHWLDRKTPGSFSNQTKSLPSSLNNNTNTVCLRNNAEMQQHAHVA
jgi:hypothetical protein